MKTRTVLLGAVACLALAPAAMAERGSDGALNIIMWQAPSTINIYLTGGTKEVIASSMVLEPLASAAPDGTLVPRLATEIPSIENGGSLSCRYFS